MNKTNLFPNELEFQMFDDGSIDLIVGTHIPPQFEERATSTLLRRGLTEFFKKSSDGIQKRCFSITGRNPESSRSMTARRRWRFEEPLQKSQAECKAETIIESLQKMAGVPSGPAYQPNTKKQMSGGWSFDNKTGAMQHSTDGSIVTTPHPQGGFNVTHHQMGPDGSTARGIGRAKDVNHAGQMIRAHIGSLKPQRASQLVKPPTAMAKEEMDKSSYGPKKMNVYDSIANIKRKAKNLGDEVGEGPNVKVKPYSTSAGQQSAGQQAASTAQKDMKRNKKQPVISLKDMSPEKQAEMKRLYKNETWADHPPFPNADVELQKVPQTTQNTEEAMAQQLANMMLGKSMLGQKPPSQPTDEEMFGHLVTNEEELQKKEAQWGNVMNNWLAEASKPISQRFNSEEEEMEFWSKIKVSDRDDGKSGY